MTLKPEQMDKALQLIRYMNTEQITLAALELRGRSDSIRRSKAAKIAGQLEPGVTRVRLGSIKPQYLSGLEGTYKGPGPKQGTVTVFLDQRPVAPRSRSGRQRQWSQEVFVPTSTIVVLP